MLSGDGVTNYSPVSEERMTTQKAAEYLGVNPSRVRQLARAGLIQADREETPRGPVFWFHRSALDDYRAYVEQQNRERKGQAGRPYKVPGEKQGDGGLS